MKKLLLILVVGLFTTGLKAQWVHTTFDFDPKANTVHAFYDEPLAFQNTETKYRIQSTAPMGWYTVNANGNLYGPFEVTGEDMRIVGNFYAGRMHGRVKYYKGDKLAMVRHYKQGKVVKTIKY